MVKKITLLLIFIVLTMNLLGCSNNKNVVQNSSLNSNIEVEKPNETVMPKNNNPPLMPREPEITLNVTPSTTLNPTLSAPVPKVSSTPTPVPNENIPAITPTKKSYIGKAGNVDIIKEYKGDLDNDGKIERLILGDI